MIGAVTMTAMADEMLKISAVSAPSVVAPPAPGGLTGALNAKPAAPVSPGTIQAKALKSTNLQKTNYTTVSTKLPTPNFSMTAGQKAMTPPPVG